MASIVAGARPSPAGQADDPGAGWRPAPFTLLLHRVADRPVLHFGGEPIAGTWCGRSALAGERARQGPRHWQHWPRCPECSAAEAPEVRP